MEKIILKHALANAVEHNGKAEFQSVLGGVIAERPEAKEKIREIVPAIKKIIIEVNSMSKKKQETQLKKMGFKEERKEKKGGLPELPNAGKAVIMRLAPYPSGPLHIGNARMVLLNDEYVKKYKGKLILVFDDTIGSEEKFIIPEGYNLIKEGLDWLGVKYHEVLYKSDRIQIFYQFAQEMLQKNLAYVCTCPEKILRENRKNGVECSCRSNTAEKNLELWRKMLSGGFKEGGAAVRLKTDMNYPNPAFRDRVLLRIAEREHPRVGKKYRVWPMLEFSWAVDDHLLCVTHILRGKDLVMEDMMEEFIWQRMGWRSINFLHYGLLNIEEAKLSKSESRKAIEIGEYSGWDDPRTWSMQSLRRRGIKPQAIRNFIVGMGLSLADVTVPAEILYAENRKLIDKEANRYFVVMEPEETAVYGGMKIKSVKAPLHPDDKKRGSRTIKVNPAKIYVERNDLKNFSGKEVGLMNLATVKLGRKSQFMSEKIKMKTQKIHWVSEPHVAVKIVMPNGTAKHVLGEESMLNLKGGKMIQMQRVGFARVDKVDKAGKDIVLYFAHK
jgi:glutamyl-tRNA synthetase